jgi:hypothetical protein
MRALCGAIITAGALIGLGLAAVGLGSRYHGATNEVLFKDIDNPLKLVLVLLVIGVVVGVAIAFIGLMFHHERRHRELTLHAPP